MLLCQHALNFLRRAGRAEKITLHFGAPFGAQERELNGDPIVIAQLFLSFMLGGILLYAWMEYARSPVIALSGLLAACGGLYFVWFPAHATLLAEAVGIGRGVDLIIYVWVVISLLVVFNLHLKLRSQMELITGLAREIAILKVASSDHRDRPVGN